VKPELFVDLLRKERGTAILRTPDFDAAGPAMRAAIRGGFRIVEFTLSIPRAMDLIQEFAELDLIVGAGTVLTADQAREAVARGAKFLVSPVVDEAVIEAAAKLGVASIPGTYTPTEMLRAHRAGAPLVKLFPQASPAYVRQVLGPLPDLKIVPTAGVDASNAAEYLKAGAWAVGFVSSLFRPDDLAARSFDSVESRARSLLASLDAKA
jgi:Entner-Doudoroff aldolase